MADEGRTLISIYIKRGQKSGKGWAWINIIEPIGHLHISRNTPFLLPKILHRRNLKLLLGPLWCPGETKNKSYLAMQNLGRGRGKEAGIMEDVQMLNWPIRTTKQHLLMITQLKKQKSNDTRTKHGRKTTQDEKTGSCKLCGLLMT